MVFIDRPRTVTAGTATDTMNVGGAGNGDRGPRKKGISGGAIHELPLLLTRTESSSLEIKTLTKAELSFINNNHQIRTQLIAFEKQAKAAGKKAVFIAFDTKEKALKFIKAHPKEIAIGTVFAVAAIGLTVIAIYFPPSIPVTVPMSGKLFIIAGAGLAAVACQAQSPISPNPIPQSGGGSGSGGGGRSGGPKIANPTPLPETPDTPSSDKEALTPYANNEIAKIQLKINEGKLEEAKDKALELLGKDDLSTTIEGWKYIKSEILRLYLDALEQDSQNYKKSVDEVDQIYSQWVSKSAEGNSKFVSITINVKNDKGVVETKTFKGIGSLKNKGYIWVYGKADVAKIKNLIEKKDVAAAKTEALKILGREDNDANKDYQPYTKKLALAVYLDAMTRESKKYRKSVNKAHEIYTAWNDVQIGATFSLVLEGKTYYGIGAIDKTKEKYIVNTITVLGIKKQVEDASDAEDETKLGAAISSAKQILADTSYLPYVKKQAYATLLDAMSRSTDFIGEAHNQYTLWKAAKPGTLFTATIKDPATNKDIPYDGIAALDPSDDGYLFSASYITEINYLIYQGVSNPSKLDEAKTKALEVLARGEEDPSIKKRALSAYIDALRKQPASLGEAVRIADAREAASREAKAKGPDATMEITINGIPYYGIEPIALLPIQTQSLSESIHVGK